MFVNTFITRPILATVCSLLIMLAGAIAIPTLPIARFPELTPPSVTVPTSEPVVTCAAAGRAPASIIITTHETHSNPRSNR